MSYKIKTKHLDLLAAYNRNDEPSRALKTMKVLIAPIVLVLIFAIVFASMTMITMGKKNELKTVTENIEVIQLKIDSTDKTDYEKLQTMETALSNIESLDQSLSSLPEITREKLLYLQSDLLSTVKLKSITFDQSTNILTASLNSDNVQNIEKYVEKLRNHAEYTSVEYTGYQRSTSTTTSATDLIGPDGQPITNVATSESYSFQVKISLEGKAGK